MNIYEIMSLYLNTDPYRNVSVEDEVEELAKFHNS